MLRKMMVTSMILVLARCGSGGGSSAPAAVTPSPAANSIQGLSTPVTLNPSLSGDYVRINAIDGKYSATHPPEIYVHPGDVITLSADVFLAHFNFNPAGRPVEAFAWYSSLNAQDHCSPSLDQNCLQHSNFLANNFGVAYYVPYAMGQSLQLVVSSLDSNEVDRSGHRISDRIILHNMNWDGRPQPAPQVVTLPQQYPAPTLNPSLALIGAGRWVTIENVRYFTPYTYVVQGEEQWMPYRHGYWAYDAHAGFTWISYDPWGWLTDHYGIWRHHASYGWLWLPFEGNHFEPHNVTFFGQGEWIGWYPYNESYRSLYLKADEALGFDDGYWLGHQVGLGFSGAASRYRPGFSLIARTQFTDGNLINAITAHALVPNSGNLLAVQEAFAQGRVFAVPGGGTSAQGLDFVQRGARQVPQTQILNIRSRGGASILQAQPIYSVPTESRHFLNALNAVAQPVAIGTMAQNHEGSSVIVPPTLNGRGLVPAPLIRNAEGHVTGTLPLRTTQVAELNPLNGLSSAAESRGLLKPVDPKQVPGFDPQKAEPPARIPTVPAVPLAPKTTASALVPSSKTTAPAATTRSRLNEERLNEERLNEERLNEENSVELPPSVKTTNHPSTVLDSMASRRRSSGSARAPHRTKPVIRPQVVDLSREKSEASVAGDLVPRPSNATGFGSGNEGRGRVPSLGRSR